MNCEENRLRTFHTWPCNAIIEPQRIAKAGFFYTGEDFQVECFSCGGRISQWEYGDQVMGRHRQLNPDCPFVKSPTQSGNMPLLSSASSPLSSLAASEPSLEVAAACSPSEERSYVTGCGASQATEPDTSSGTAREESYRSEAVRLQTFANWPKSHIVSPENLAKCGFYYMQVEDKVQCAFCSGVIGHWEAGDDPKREHRRHFPSCPLHYNIPVGNIPISVEENSSPNGMTLYRDACSNVAFRSIGSQRAPEGQGHENSVQPARTLPSRSNEQVQGIQSYRGPRHPKYSTVESRLRTYANWSSDRCHTPQQLSEAGFYYTGVRDHVRCFHCDGGLRQWDESDDPWQEHAHWFPKCVFVVLMKGEEFIQEVAARHPLLLPTEVKTASNQSHTRIRHVTEEELDGLMNTLPVQMAVRVGLDISKIRQAVKEKMEQTGMSYVTSDALIGAVLDMPSRTQVTDPSMAGPSQEGPDTAALSLEGQTCELPQEGRCVERRHHPEELQSLENRTAPGLSWSAPLLPNMPSYAPKASVEGEMALSHRNLGSNTKHCDEALTLEEENRKLKEARLCKICMDEEVGVVFLPCGHLVTCVHCTVSLCDCPLCREPIRATVRTFLS